MDHDDGGSACPHEGGGRGGQATLMPRSADEGLDKCQRPSTKGPYVKYEVVEACV